MEINIKENYEEMSDTAFLFLKKRIEKKPDIVLGLSTGSTPLGLYKRMSSLDLKKATSFNLDEYCIDFDHKQSYHTYMKENLFDKTGIQGFVVENIKEYENKIKESGGIDVQVLGIGRNGHIGFNEPGSNRESRTRVIELSDITREDNKKVFGDEVPEKAMTMGIGTILEAKEILLLVSGRNKAEIIKKALKGEVTEQVPASLLQNHPNVTVILDKEAASLL